LKDNIEMGKFKLPMGGEVKQKWALSHRPLVYLSSRFNGLFEWQSGRFSVKEE
jgi:hypothetical protein